MKTACSCLTGTAALALAFAVVATPTPVAAGPNPLNDPLERDHTSPYAYTAIGAVIDANAGNVPATGESLVETLAKFGDFVQLPIPFSAVASDSGLTHPRVVITMRPSSHPAEQEAHWGYSGPTRFTPSPKPLNYTAPNRTQLEGRLFLAANMELDRFAFPVVRSVEFISWNSRKAKFDFGVIEGMNTHSPELKLLDGVRCFSCHKNRGPILGVAPWSNTMHNPLIRETASALLLPVSDGIAFFNPHAAAVDAAVRQGGNLVRDRVVFKELAATPEGRKALVLLFQAVFAPGEPVEKAAWKRLDGQPGLLASVELIEHDKRVKKELNALAPVSFVRNAQSVRLAAISSELRDFRPPGKVIQGEGEWWFGPRLDLVARFDRVRADNANLPAAHVPSNPKAFVQFPPRVVRQPSDAVSAVLLAKTIGLSEADRWFLFDMLDETVDRLNHPALAHAGVLTLILNGPAFADMMTTGVLPDRDDFKDRFMAGASALLKARKRDDYLPADRDSYTSTPMIDPNAKHENEPVVLPSHACLGCHEVRKPSKQAFTPIPMLAFDPFDATARNEWLKTTDRKRKAEVLGRMLKRLGTDKDMPPEDSTEAALYRVKDPTALNAVRNWLDAELKKVKVK